MILIGNHETLMAARGAYYGLVEAQNLRMKSNKNELEEDDEIIGMKKLFFSREVIMCY